MKVKLRSTITDKYYGDGEWRSDWDDAEEIDAYSPYHSVLIDSHGWKNVSMEMVDPSQRLSSLLRLGSQVFIAWLKEPVHDYETDSTFVSGLLLPVNKRRVNTPIEVGGGFIATEKMAEELNEERGIASGLRAGVSYPNEVCVGHCIPLEMGEDDQFTQDVIPLLFDDPEIGQYSEEAECMYNDMQKVFMNLHRAKDEQVVPS